MGFADLERGGVKELSGGVINALLTGALVFGIAGRTDLPGAWLYVALGAVWSFGHTLVLVFVDPELLNVRGDRPTDTKRWDMAMLAVFGLAWPLGIPIAAGLDLRDGPDLGLSAAVAGTAIHLLGTALVVWAVSVNRFFEKTARIQTDRGQVVCEAGPYAWVRHPGYLSTILLALAAPLVLGSLWSVVPAAIAAGAMVVRTVLEDRMLQRELVGYAAYTERVRWRLIPGLW